MTELFYHLLKKYQKYKGSGMINTHRGFAPTPGSWLLTNYAADSSVREWLYKGLVHLTESSVPFATVENIDYLPSDALTRVRIDLDVNLSTDESAAFQPHLAAFIDTLYNVLYEYTNVKPESDLAGMIILLEKPHCTARKKGGFKHGAKLTLPYLVATHTDMLQLRVLLLQQAGVWMPAFWHGETPALNTSIIDPCVYTSNGWLMYGSQKKEQIHGGYKATRVWYRKGDICPVADCDWTLLELQRMLSIFCDLETDDDVETLEWIKTPPEVEQRSRKRRNPTATTPRQHVGMSASVLTILTEILAGLGDTTSVLTHESTEQGLYRYRISRHGKSAPCANKIEHASNCSILQLTTLFGRPVVKYNCFSMKCGGGHSPVAVQCAELAKRWAEAEAAEACKRLKTTPSASADCASVEIDMPEEEEREWYGGNIPDKPKEESRTAVVDANPARTKNGYMATLLDVTNKFISVMIAMNGGKSYGAIELAKANSDWVIWFITARQSHAFALLQTIIANGLDCAMYLKIDWTEKIQSRIKIVQYQSLYAKLKRCTLPQMVVMDETKALADAIQCVPTNQSNLMNNWMFLKDIVCSVLKVLFLDADMCRDGAAYALQDILYKHCRKTTVERLMEDAEALQAFSAHPVAQQKILRREYPVSQFDMQRTVKKATGAQQWKLLVQDLSAGHRVLVVCGSVKEATVSSKRVAEFVTGELGIGLYTSESANKEDLQNLTECWNRFQIIIISSTITIGLDYQPLLHRVYILPHIMSFTPQQAWQGSGRCRNCFTGDIVVRWDGNGAHLREITRQEIDNKVRKQLQNYVERKGVIETRVAKEKCRMYFTLEREIVQGQASTVCGDMLTLMAHSKVERSYCHSDSEWMSYFLYIAKRKGIPISDIAAFEDVDSTVEEQPDEEVAAEAKEALQAEGEYRAEIFSKMSVAGLPMYSMNELLAATKALEKFSSDEVQEARAAHVLDSCHHQGLPQLEQQERVQALRKANPVLDACLTRDELREKAKSLNAILRFERTGHGEAKDAFMSQQRACKPDFGEYDLKLLCTKLLMTKMFPGTEITLKFVKQFEKHRLAVTNQVRLMQDGGIVSTVSSADFLTRVYNSDRVDTMQHKHLIVQEAERLVRALGFNGLRDFTTTLPGSSITVKQVVEEMHVLHLLGIATARVKPAEVAKKLKRKQPKDTTVISRALSAAVGITLQAKRSSGSQRRKSQDTGCEYMLAVAKPVQAIMNTPSELVVEHWYRRKYNQEPPHLDGLYEGDVQLTDELRPLMMQRQKEEDERVKKQENIELAAALEERLRQHNLQPMASVVPQFID
jgi:hypothetical protein